MINVSMDNGFTIRDKRNGFVCAILVTQVQHFQLFFLSDENRLISSKVLRINTVTEVL